MKAKVAKMHVDTFEEYMESRLTPAEQKKIHLQAEIMEKIIEARKEKNISQKELGKILNVNQSAIARLESARIVPRLDTLIDVLYPLGYTIQVVPLASAMQQPSK